MYEVYLLAVCTAMAHAGGGETVLLICPSKKCVRHIEHLKFIPILDKF
jgi:hypothetical protein